MKFRKRAHQCETEPRAFLAQRSIGGDLFEGLAKPLDLVRRNAAAAVGNGKTDHPFGFADADGNPATRRCKFH